MASMAAVNFLALSILLLGILTSAWVTTIGKNGSSAANINRDFDLCVPGYSSQSGVKSSGIGQLVVPATLAWCGQVCQDDGNCVGFDLNPISCTVYTQSNFNNKSKVANNVQYTKTSECTAVCHSSWDILANKAAMAGGGGLVILSVKSNNLTGCLEFCARGTPDCIGIEYQPTSNPALFQPCRYFPSTSKSGMLNTVTNSAVTQYRLNQRCAETCEVTWPIQHGTRYSSLTTPTFSTTSKNTAACLKECVLNPLCTIITVNSATNHAPFQCLMANNYDVDSDVADATVDSYLYEESCP